MSVPLLHHLALAASLLAFAQASGAQSGININSGDTVSVATGQGWVLAVVVGRQQHLFTVRVINGPEVTRYYPAELRRRGNPSAYDRANGIYGVDDRIKVHYEGQWIDSRVLSGIGMEYQVELPGNRMAWAKPEQMRFVREAPPKDVAKAGKAPTSGTPELCREDRGTLRSVGDDAGPDDIPSRKSDHVDDG